MRVLLAISCLFVVLFAACSGGGGKNGATTSTPQPPSTTEGTAAPSATAAPTVDLFAGLNSYHYQMGMTGDGATSIVIKGSIVAPDSVSIDFYLSDTDTPVNSLVIIGSQAWTKDSTTGEWQSIDVAEAQSEIQGLLPKDFWGDFPMDKIIGVSSDLGEENVNGIQSHHYQISQASPDTMAKLVEIFGTGDPESQPQSFDMDLWRADDGGWPVKANISATYPQGSQITQASVTWEVSDVNSSAVTVQPPD